MSSITDLLAAILAAKKGEEVRGSIHDAIEQCYEDGRAGVNDLQARQLIEAVAAVNEEQAAALEVLQARVEELESGEGGSSQQSTTIDIPTVLVDGGVVENVSVNNNSTTTRHITFTTEFTETPKVMVAIGKNVGAVSQYGYLSANILYPTVTTTGFDFFLANRTGSDRSPGVVWYAYQPTVKTIDLDITIPKTEGMTEAEVREITGPIAAAVDALKTGYDGTSYQTAAEAVRTQINDLHVLIGDEPGTTISADSVGYEDGSVADALTGLNGRLTQQGTNIGDLSQLNTEEKADLVSAINEAANSGGVGSHALPVLYLYGDENEIQTNWNNRSKAKMNFRYVFHNLNKNKQKNGWCKLSLQGNATMSYPKHNFNIQFYKDAGFTTKDKVDYMDLTDDKHPKWTIKANYNDYSQGRNVVSARLWGDVVHCRPNMSKALSEAPNHGAIDGHPVILMMNDTYYGLYMFNMSKSDWMIGIDEDDPAHCAVSSNLATASTKWLSTGLSGWELEIPDTWQTVDIEGVSTSVQAGFLALQSFIINSTDADFYASLGDYLDINSAIDYLIYSFCVCNADSMNKNQFLVTWDAGKTWAFTAYDMDQTFGAGFTGEIPYNHDLFSTHPNHLFERLIDNFYAEILERYAVLRGSVFSTEYVNRELEIFFNEIPTGEREADKVLYPRIMFQSISTLEAMQTFAQNRLAWCDTYFARIDPAYVPCTGITLNKNSITFAEVGSTDTLVATKTPSNCSDTVVWSSSNTNVATVSDGVVTSVGDGSCTITATCGEYSATASVSVEIDDTIVYRLPTNLVGTTLVDAWDSGEMVFSSDGDISVVFDCEGTNFDATQKFIILANEFFVRDKSGRFNMIFGGTEGNAQDSSENLLTFVQSTFSGNTLTSANPFKFVITHAVGETTATIYVKDTNGTKGSATVTKKSTNTSWYGNSNLIVGANGKRTVLNKLNVYNRVLSQSEIDAFLGN